MGTGRVDQTPMGAPPMGAEPIGASPVVNLEESTNPNVGVPVGVPLAEPIMLNGVENVPVESILPYQFI